MVIKEDVIMGLTTLTTKYKRRDTYKKNVSTLTHKKEYIIIQSVQILYKKLWFNTDDRYYNQRRERKRSMVLIFP